MTDFLARMADESRARVADAKRGTPEALVVERALRQSAVVPLALNESGFDIIAEIKKRAPSAGTLHDPSVENDSFIDDRVAAYTDGGATAISVLTEPSAFHGSLHDLATATKSAPVPIMRKDFLVDPYQVYEARTFGASGVLLIARLLERSTLEHFFDAAATTGQFVLLEFFEEGELHLLDPALRIATQLGITILVGVNSRNLSTLGVDTERFTRFAPELPDEIPSVAESGIESPDDIRSIATLGYNLALVGTSLMTASNPTTTVQEFLAAGRQVRSSCA